MIHDILRQRLLQRAGLEALPPPRYTLDELSASEWSPQFEHLMRNRLIMGALRYGKLGDKNKPQYDRTDSIQRRLAKYRLSGNMELLVDIANLCLCEFVECHHPTKHFHSVDDGEHVAKI